MASVNMTSGQYAQYMKLIDSKDKYKGYLFENLQTMEYNLFFLRSKVHSPTEFFRPLTLRDITLLGRRLQSDLEQNPDDASAVSLQLAKMSANRIHNEEKHNVLFRLVIRICNCTRNFFSGLGFNTTARLASELSEQLALFAAMHTPIPSEIDAKHEPLHNLSEPSQLEKIPLLKPEPLSSFPDVPPKISPILTPKETPSKLRPKKPLPEIIATPEPIIPKPVLYQEPDPSPVSKPALVPDSRPPKIEPRPFPNIVAPIPLREPVLSIREPISTPQNFNERTPSLSYVTPVQTEKEFSEGKTKALADYKKDPAKCSIKDKAILFKDIKAIKSPHYGYPSYKVSSLKLTTVVDLMLYLSGLSKVDLRDTMCVQVVVDTIRACNKDTSEQLVEWMLKEKSFGATLLGKCLSAFLEKDSLNQPTSSYAIQQLILHYNKQSWHKKLPVNDPSISGAMVLLIKGEPNNSTISFLAENIMDQPEFDLNTFVQWLSIFKKKEEEKSFAPNLYYPLRDKLIAYLDKNSDWKQIIKVRPEYKEVQEYLEAKIRAPEAQPAPGQRRPLPHSKSTPALPSNKPTLTSVVSTPSIHHSIKKLPEGKTKALESYKSNPELATQMSKMIVFQDIKMIKPATYGTPSHKIDEASIISIVDLMLFTSGQIDLGKNSCKEIVIDAIHYCKKDITDKLIEWLGKEPTFNTDLLQKCLTVMIQKDENQQPYSILSLEQLLTIYEERSWNKEIPANTPAIVNTLSILISHKPNEDKTSSLVEWMLMQPDYELLTFVNWIRIFMKKEADNASSPNLYYPLRDKLIEHCLSISGWVARIESDDSLKDVRAYLANKKI